MVKRYVRKMNRLGSMVLPRLRISGDSALRQRRRWLCEAETMGTVAGDIKDKNGVGDMQKQVRRCHVNSFHDCMENPRRR